MEGMGKLTLRPGGLLPSLFHPNLLNCARICATIVSQKPHSFCFLSISR
jgi:hypothetical protein